MPTELCTCCGAECPDRGRVKKFAWVTKTTKNGSKYPAVVTVYFCSLRCASFHNGLPGEIHEIKEYK